MTTTIQSDDDLEIEELKEKPDCKTCRFCHGSRGECRRYPPVAPTPYANHAIFPTVANPDSCDYNWCGEYKPRANVAERAMPSTSSGLRFP